MYYFAYGSNMSLKRLTRRIPAEKLGVATLNAHRLAFTKPSETDGSAKCDICPTENQSDVVYGVLYTFDEEHKPVLDTYEGLGYGYTSEKVMVSFKGQAMEAITYRAVNRNDSLKPFKWYREHVIRGARENGMPDSYVKNIQSIPAKTDPDRERASMELSIYQ